MPGLTAGRLPTRPMLQELPWREGTCVNQPVPALTAACARACRVALGSQAHLNLLMDAAEQVGCALDQMHSKNVAHLDIKVTAPPAAQPERLQ